MEARAVKTKEDARKIVEERGLKHVKVGVFDIDGILRGKYMAKEKFFSALKNGFGFCDVIETPGNDANTISRQEFKGNAALFLKRIENYALSMNGSLKRICFVGKRQWKQLFTPILARCDHGKQSNEHRPRNWPVSLIGVDVWILPSPSGRAVLSNEERGAPYRDLASEIDDI